MAKQKRIICYAINGAGLGHVTRLLAVAKWLRRYGALLDERPPEILFLTSSDASDILADAGFAAFKIPSKTVARKTELNKLEYRRLAKHFVWNMLGVFSPDLLVVDTFPSGSFDELFQVLDGPFKKSFIYRKVKPEYAARPTFRSAIRMYDAVVAPHAGQAGLQSGAEQFANGGKKIQFSGEVIQFEHEDMLAPKLARQQLGVPDDHRLIYVSAGGGGDPNAEEQLHALVDAIGRQAGVHLLVGAGPLYRGKRIAGDHVIWFDGPSIGKYFSAVDAAVCAAGYNTFHELLFAGVPTAFFAQDKIADDQAERIEQARQAGACLMVKNWQEAEQIQQAVSSLLDSTKSKELQTACTEFMPGNGARQCAIELLAPLYDSDRLNWARQILSPRVANRLEAISGSASAISEWLIPLAPQSQIQNLKDNSVLTRLMSQLSEPANKELQSLLDADQQGSNQSAFENQLIDLLDTIDLYSLDQKASVAGEAHKTILSAMKKQPLVPAGPSTSTTEEGFSHWVGDIIHGVNMMLRAGCTDTLDAIEAVRLFRVFPRIVDADAVETFELFETFIETQRAANALPHEISKTLQLIKMKHSRVTKAIIESSLAGSSSTPRSPSMPKSVVKPANNAIGGQ